MNKLIVKDSEDILTLSEERDEFRPLLSSKNHFCWDIFNENIKMLKDLKSDEVFYSLQIFLNETAIFLNISKPSVLLVKMISEKLINSKKFQFFKITEIKKALDMAITGDIVNKEDQLIKCYNNINGAWFFECLHFYAKKRMVEISKIHREKDRLDAEIYDKSRKKRIEEAEKKFFDEIKKV